MSITIRKHIQTAVLLALVSGNLVTAGCRHQSNAAPTPQETGTEVAVVLIAPQHVNLTTELPGRISAFQAADIRPQVNGIIQKCLFREGSDVKAGQQLYQIDPAPFQVKYESAGASLGKALANLPSIQVKVDRYRELLSDNAVSRQDYDDAAAALEQVRADIEYWKTAVESARIDLNYTLIRASFPGRIGRSYLKIGSLVTAYQASPLATLQQLDPVYVDVVQSSAELLRLRRNQETGLLSSEEEGLKKVRIFLEDGTPYSYEGVLQFADVTVDPTTGSFSLRIVVPNPDHILLPGMFVRAVVKEGVAPQGILIPQQGVSRTPKGEPVALVVDDAGKAQQRPLTLDRAIGDQWLVTSGLSAGDRLIVEGMLHVRPGMAIKSVVLNEEGRNRPAVQPSAMPAK